MYVRANDTFASAQGASFYTAPNPAYGATLTYFLKESPKTLRQKRQDAERDAERRKVPFKYPSIAELRAETEEEPPAIIFTIADSDGKVVRRLNAPAGAGIQRTVWDMRFMPPSVTAPPTGVPGGGGGGGGFGFGGGPQGQLVMPGKYTVTMALRSGGVVTAMPGSQTFSVVVEGKENISTADAKALAEFQKKVGTLQRAVGAASGVATEAKTRIGLYKRSAAEAPTDNKKLLDQAEAFDNEIDALINEIRGGRENTEIPPPSIAQRVGNVAGTIRLSTIKPTASQIANYELANAEFSPVLARLRKLIEIDMPRLEKELEAAGAPLTPGRLPQE